MIAPDPPMDLNTVLRAVASRLDLDETRHRNAIEKYQAIGNWLNAENSALAPYSPQIYPQGSFLLGTTVRPLAEDEYDIDLVCLLSGISPTARPQEIKAMVGDRLKENERYSGIIEEKNRCWRLHYAGEFHLDIIPAIPDTEKKADAILVPDRELRDWTWSDPKGYAAWFQACMLTRAEMRAKAVEAVPDYPQKVPLQLTVQLMKRHRDIVFENDHDRKPISIIITTLAARAYEKPPIQADLFETLKQMARDIPNQITNDNGELWVSNPVNPDENFADKWPEHPERQAAFYQWVEKLEADLSQLEHSPTPADRGKIVLEIFGEKAVSSTPQEESVLRRTGTRSARFNVRHRKDPASKWNISLSGEASVQGFIKTGENHRSEFYSDSNPLDKELSLVFLARTRNIERPYAVCWQVVNTGEEAEERGQLRGGFYPSTSPSSHQRSERTQYKGMHWIEVFIIKDGTCVARSGEFVVNIK